MSTQRAQGKKAAVSEPGNGLSPDPKSIGILILDFSTSRTTKIVSVDEVCHNISIEKRKKIIGEGIYQMCLLGKRQVDIFPMKSISVCHINQIIHLPNL